MIFDLIKGLSRREGEASELYVIRLGKDLVTTLSDQEIRLRKLEGRDPVLSEEETRILNDFKQGLECGGKRELNGRRFQELKADIDRGLADLAQGKLVAFSAKRIAAKGRKRLAKKGASD
jgi:hypothetical protein